MQTFRLLLPHGTFALAITQHVKQEDLLRSRLGCSLSDSEAQLHHLHKVHQHCVANTSLMQTSASLRPIWPHQPLIHGKKIKPKWCKSLKAANMQKYAV